MMCNSDVWVWDISLSSLFVAYISKSFVCFSWDLYNLNQPVNQPMHLLTLIRLQFNLLTEYNHKYKIWAKESIKGWLHQFYTTDFGEFYCICEGSSMTCFVTLEEAACDLIQVMSLSD